MADFSGKVFSVTAAGAGIGAAIARRLAALGAAVVVSDVIRARALAVANSIQEAGGHAAAIAVDVRLEADADALVAFSLDCFGRLDGAVNNAGLGHAMTRLHEVPTADWDLVTSVTLDGVFFGMRAQLRHFVASGGGVIVNTASGAGLKGGAGQSSYVAAKHGVVGLTKTAAIEYIRDNIRVNAVAPGLVNTEITKVLPQEVRESLQPGGRAADPIEIANAVVWLLSDEASFVSGTILLVDAAGMQR